MYAYMDEWEPLTKKKKEGSTGKKSRELFQPILVNRLTGTTSLNAVLGEFKGHVRAGSGR